MLSVHEKDPPTQVLSVREKDPPTQVLSVYEKDPPLTLFQIFSYALMYDPQKHHRRSIRLPGFDYSQAGAYCVTIVTSGREYLFGKVMDAEMILNQFGQIVDFAWHDLPEHYGNVELDAFCIMPNHVHGIIVLHEDTSVKRQPLSEIVRAFKSFSARRINILRKTPGTAVWHRNYYEHIIRGNDDYLAQGAYIIANPRKWNKDE